MNKLPNKRHTSWIDVIFSIAIISLITIGMFLVSNSSENQAAALPKSYQDIDISTKIDTIDSNYPSINISTEISNDSSSPYAIQYPQSLHSSFNVEVSTYINKVKQDNIRTMKGLKEESEEEHGELNISFENLLHHSGNYSFLLVISNYLDGISDASEIRSFHLNPETVNILKIRDFFEYDASKLENSAILVSEAISNDVAHKKFLFPEEVLVNSKPLWKNYSNLALTNEDIIVYYDEYQFASGAARTPIIAIPLENVDAITASGLKIKTEAPVETANDQKINTDDPLNKTTQSADTDIKKIALTFDDGPHPKVTRQILATLKKYDAKATFFMLGSRVEFYPDIAKEVSEAGHELGNHSWNHTDLTKASVEKIRNEINNTNKIIEQATSQKVTVFRPPYGAANDTVRAQTDVPVILWDIDTLDWKHRDASQLLPIIKKSVKNGSNILMHDIHQSTADGLDDILANLKNEGYTFVTVSELD